MTCIREASRAEAATQPRDGAPQTSIHEKTAKFPRNFRYSSCYSIFK